MNYPVKRPHDTFFKQTLGEATIAKDFLQNYLPSSLAERMDFSTLALQNGSFVGKHLQEYFTDLLYRVQLEGKDSYLYFLLEHKSYPDPDIALQLLSYLVSIYQRLRKESPRGKLAPVIPLVFYHGKQKWTLRKEFSVLVEGYEELPEEIRLCIPNFSYRLYDIGSYGEEELRGEIPLRLALRTLKYIFHGEEAFLRTFLETVRLLEQLPDAQQRAMRFERLMNYVFVARKQIDLERMKQEMQSISAERGEQLMSMAEKLWMEGRAEGKLEEKEQIAEKMLEVDTPVSFIAHVTGLSEEHIHHLRLKMKKEK